MDTHNRCLYNRIMKNINKAVNEALLENTNDGTVKVVALKSDTLSTDSNLDLMNWGNDVSVIFILPGTKVAYYLMAPNSNVCDFSERWYTVRDINRALGNGKWEYQGIQELRDYAHRGAIGGSNTHNIRIYTGEYPISVINRLFDSKKITVRGIKGYSTVSVENFIEGLVAEGFLDE